MGAWVKVALALLCVGVFAALIIYFVCRKKSTAKQLMYYECICAAAIYLLLLAYITIFDRERMAERYIQIIPFSDIIYGLQNKSRLDLELVILNIFMFIPGGIVFGYILTYKKVPFFKIILLGASLTLLVEISQYISIRGIFDINDIIYNLLGYIIGALIVRSIRKKILTKKYVKNLI